MIIFGNNDQFMVVISGDLLISPVILQILKPYHSVLWYGILTHYGISFCKIKWTMLQKFRSHDKQITASFKFSIKMHWFMELYFCSGHVAIYMHLFASIFFVLPWLCMQPMHRFEMADMGFYVWSLFCPVFNIDFIHYFKWILTINLLD